MARVVALVVVAMLLCVALTSANQQNGKRTLVLLDDMAMLQSHSRYFDALRARGYKLDAFRADDDAVAFTDFGEFQYDSLIIFAPNSDDLGNVAVEDVLQFIDQGGEVVMAAAPKVNYAVRDIGEGCGVEFDNDGSEALDHFHKSSKLAGAIVVHAREDLKEVLGTGKVAPLLYRGTGMKLKDNNELVFPVVTGWDSTYVADQDDMSVSSEWAGKRTALVVSLQARNNARVTICGSVDMFSNEFWTEKSGNEALATSLTLWTFQERGMLRVQNVKHQRAGGDGEQQSVYMVREELEYSCRIEEWNGDKWMPFTGDGVQIELTMLDPHVRRTLTNDGKGNFKSVVRLPDVYGVFTVRLAFNQIGYSVIDERQLITIRPERHDEYERFILSAYPYYASALSMVGATVLFTFVFMFGK